MLIIGFDELSAGDLPNGWSFKYTLAVDGINILADTIVADST